MTLLDTKSSNIPFLSKENIIHMYEIAIDKKFSQVIENSKLQLSLNSLVQNQ